MQINPNLFKVSPCKNFICVYHMNYTEEIQQWQLFHNIESITSGNYVNFKLGDLHNMDSLFEQITYPDYIDGFSPNCNKELHIGHLSNLIIGKAITCLFKNWPFTEIMFTTNLVKNFSEAYRKKIEALLTEFKYQPNYYPYIKEIINDYEDYKIPLIKGEGTYENTLIIDLNGSKKVCFKADGSSTYLMEDITILHGLIKPVWYVTGKEQAEHFAYLKEYAKTHLNADLVTHIPCGLVLLGGTKMSSRTGKITLAEELINEVAIMFDNNRLLAYNIIAGQILQSSFSSDKIVDFDKLRNPKTSIGLYLSYTLARLHSAGIKLDSEYKSSMTNFIIHQSRFNITVNHLVLHMRDLDTRINKDYDNKKEFDISSEKEEIVNHFNDLGSELLFTIQLIGLFNIEKV